MIGGETGPHRFVELGGAAEPDLPVVIALGVAWQAEPEIEPGPRPLGQFFPVAHGSFRAAGSRISATAPNSDSGIEPDS